MKKHAVYFTVDELTDIVIAYDGAITLLKQNKRRMMESSLIKKNFPHMIKYYDDDIRKEEEMFERLIQIRNDLAKKEREEK